MSAYIAKRMLSDFSTLDLVVWSFVGGAFGAFVFLFFAMFLEAVGEKMRIRKIKKDK